MWEVIPDVHYVIFLQVLWYGKCPRSLVVKRHNYLLWEMPHYKGKSVACFNSFMCLKLFEPCSLWFPSWCISLHALGISAEALQAMYVYSYNKVVYILYCLSMLSVCQVMANVHMKYLCMPNLTVIKQISPLVHVMGSLVYFIQPLQTH